jgi:hypothetical protein
MIDRSLRLVTGWLLLVGAFGVGIDGWLSSWGLAPAYLGTILGLACFVFVVGNAVGFWPAILTGLGVASTFVFWGTYPENAVFGGIGALLIGLAVLYLPGWGRWASPLWIASGTLGLPSLVREGVTWGPISAFTFFGAAIAVTGIFVLLGLDQAGQTSSDGATEVEAVKGNV